MSATDRPDGSAASGDGADSDASPGTISTMRRGIVDRAWLRLDKGDWVIYRIDRLSEETLVAPPTAAPVSPASP